MKKFFFPKRSRLLTYKDYLFVFKKSAKNQTKNIVTLSCFNSLRHPRIGLIVAKKQVKQANKRNYIKRIIRESFRIYQHKLPNMDFIIIVQKNIINDINQNTLAKELQNIWKSYH
ncbi:ribonuclease P protein component [Blochmannia endosymbiont of Colobopsis nipponica]|uniref:ribonuclease P protein component n=1 Tax=Blochmannia endosymbiont of Colobopsis nipponica TaxID=2681987 RepID=UPI00177ADED3|nr:ribonuclease P protein component [Blochmannia endosymbiont of Colobopsis nipponica]QOI10832.1 ribonuclease P protein component [Blochmannia endosymbiont of Colobopsis nipponica]